MKHQCTTAWLWWTWLINTPKNIRSCAQTTTTTTHMNPNFQIRWIKDNTTITTMNKDSTALQLYNSTTLQLQKDMHNSATRELERHRQHANNNTTTTTTTTTTKACQIVLTFPHLRLSASPLKLEGGHRFDSYMASLTTLTTSNAKEHRRAGAHINRLIATVTGNAMVRAKRAQLEHLITRALKILRALQQSPIADQAQNSPTSIADSQP